jgi:hypothetical protein
MFVDSSPTASETGTIPPGEDDEDFSGRRRLPRRRRRLQRAEDLATDDVIHRLLEERTTRKNINNNNNNEEEEERRKNNFHLFKGGGEVEKTKKWWSKGTASLKKKGLEDSIARCEFNLEDQKSFSVLLEHAMELKENVQRWFEAGSKERREIAGLRQSSAGLLHNANANAAGANDRQQNSAADKGVLNINKNINGRQSPQSGPFALFQSLPSMEKIEWDPRLKQFAIYFFVVLMMETKIAIVGVQEIVPNEKRFLTPAMYSVYVKNILTRFLPLQLAIDLTFLSLGVRKRIGSSGTFEYDAEYEEKVYFWRQVIKTFFRHPQVTMGLAGLYGPVSHEFSAAQFGAIVLLPLIIGKYSISRYSSLKYSIFYSIMSAIYAFLFQFSAPEVREMWFENKFETYKDVTATMYSRLSPQYMAFIFFVPLAMHLMYVVVNARGKTKKFISLSLPTTANVYKREMTSRFNRMRFKNDERNVKIAEINERAREERPTLSPMGRRGNERGRTTTTTAAATPETTTIVRRRTRSQTNSPSSPAGNDNSNDGSEDNPSDNNFLEVLGFGTHLKSRSKRLRDSPPSSSNNTSGDDGSDGGVGLDVGATALRGRRVPRNKRNGHGARGDGACAPADLAVIAANAQPIDTAANGAHALSFIDIPKERYDYVGELCGRSVEEECVVMDGTHVVIHPPPPSSASTPGGSSASGASIFSAFKPARNILFPYAKKNGTSGCKSNAETIRSVDHEFTQVLEKLKELHSKSVVVSNNANGEFHDLSVRIDGTGTNVMSCSVWRGFTPDSIPIRAMAEKIKPSQCYLGVGRAQKTAYTNIRAGISSDAAMNDKNIDIDNNECNAFTVKSQSRFPHSYPRIISVSPMCVLPGVKTRIQIRGRSLKNMILCARLHGKPDIEEIFMHNSDQQRLKMNKNGRSIALFKLPKLRQSRRDHHATLMKEDDEMRLDASDEMEQYELEEHKRERDISRKNENINTNNSISYISDTSSEDEQLEQAPLETVYVDVCVDALYDGGLFFLQFLNVPFASASIPIVVTPFLDIKREIDAKLSNRKLGDGARVVLFKCAEITGGRGMDWNTDNFADACEHDLGCSKYADLVRAAKPC